ncbi:hypothetical protein AB1Y20_023541 [Prymnesium parvum]|uniref:Uncharacterized protein n=1 Tax=Prymnesium parvum TaxID=97485 RepID=A0AB34JH54_PRYPA
MKPPLEMAAKPELPSTTRDYVQLGGERCADGAHLLFVPVIPMGSIVMRGLMPLLLLNQTYGRMHAVRTSYLEFGRPTLNASMDARLQHHAAVHGPPSVCVVLKYPQRAALEHCRRAGAVVLLDCIDNHRCFAGGTLAELREYDAALVQTHEHAAFARGRGVRAAVLPHPHGDHRYVRPRPALNWQLKGVGFIFGDPKNMLSREVQRMFCHACVRANATLYLIHSPSNGVLQPPRAVRCEQWLLKSEANSSRLAPPEAMALDGRAHAGARHPAAPPRQRACGGRQEHWSAACPSRRQGSSDLGEASPAAAGARAVDSLPPLRDLTGQHRFFSSEASRKVQQLVDVGILWPPSPRAGHSAMATRNRPPTRMHWWLSQGIPVIGYPMPAYIDAARRINYPLELMNITSAESLEAALCQLAPHRRRTCLQDAVVRGGDLASPINSALELLAVACRVSEASGKPLNRIPMSSYAIQPLTRNLIRGGR